jgi:hypothetical protein
MRKEIKVLIEIENVDSVIEMGKMLKLNDFNDSLNFIIETSYQCFSMSKLKNKIEQNIKSFVDDK